MDGLIKQLVTPKYPLAQLSEHKTEDQRKTCWCGFESREFCERFVLIFTK